MYKVIFVVPDVTQTFTGDSQNPTIPYVGANISYSCQTDFPGNLMGLTGIVEVSDSSGTPIDSTGDRVMVSETTTLTGNTFTRTLRFSPLSAEDMGEYSCTGTIQPVTPNPLVTNSMGSVTLNIFTIGKKVGSVNCETTYSSYMLSVVSVPLKTTLSGCAVAPPM